MPDNPTALPVVLPATLTVTTIESIELPENADLDQVTVSLTNAPAGSSAIFDVLDNGTSMFATALGTIRTGETAQGNDSGSPMSTSSTTIVLTPGPSGLAPRKNQVVTVDSEDMQCVDVEGSYQTEGGAPEYTLTVTRGFNGTTAATHAVGTSVYPALPKVTAGATASAGVYVPAFQSSPEIATGSVVAVKCTQIGSTTAGGGGTVTLELAER